MLTSGRPGAGAKARGLLVKVSPSEVGQPGTLLTIVKVGHTMAGPSGIQVGIHQSSDGSPPEMRSNCAYCAQEVPAIGRVRVSIGSRFALWFAPSYANLVRTRPVVTTLVTTGSYQCERLPGAGFHCGFQGFAVVSTGNMPRSGKNRRTGSREPLRTFLVSASAAC